MTSPLDPSQLSHTAQRVLGPGPGRAMAARGLMPLAPLDQVAVLYQLSLDPDAAVAQAARLTAAGLPDKLLGGTLADASVDPRVLDFFAHLAGDKPGAFDAIVGNPAASDPTIAALASRGDGRAVDRIAENEQRLLRHPEIIAAMYMNRRARMSTIDRVVELAVRNNVRVPGVAAWDEVARALTGGEAVAGQGDDQTFERALAVLSGDDSALTTGPADEVLPDDKATPHDAAAAKPEEEVDILKLPMNQQIRLAQLGNAFARNRLVRSPNRVIAVAAIKNPGVTEIEARAYAANPTLAEDVIRYIAGKREFTKDYGTKVSLCRNPKAPIADTLRLLPFLRPKDLINLSKSRGVPSALVAGARKLVAQRTSGK